MLSQNTFPSLTQAQWEALHAPFPPEALSADTSRGFELTSIKAAYIIERLNEVFGPCGIGWRYVHNGFEQFDTKNGGLEVLTEVAFQFRLQANEESSHSCPPIEWCGATGSWSGRQDAPAVWSEPIFACGGKLVTKGGAPFTDAHKSAVTDGLTKAVSMLGVGHTVFKGLVRVGSEPVRRNDGNGHHLISAQKSQPEAEKPTVTANATTFWALYHSEGRPAGVSQQTAQALISDNNWSAACTHLRSLIAQAQPAAN